MRRRDASWTKGRESGGVEPWLIGIVGLTLYAGSRVLSATAEGIGVAPDSVTYLEAARNVLAGRGLVVTDWDGRTVPLTHYPPLFPLVLAGLGRLGLEPLAAARALHALLFAATIPLVAGAIDRSARPTSRAAFLGAGLVATSVDVLGVHVLALSEPLFIVTGLTGLTLLAGAVERGGWGRLVAAAVAVGLACLDRLIGIALIATGALALLLLARARPIGARVARATVFAALSALPLGLWALWTHAASGTVADRHVVALGISGWQVRSGLSTVAGWVLPAAGCCLGRSAITLLGGGALVIALGAVARAGRRLPAAAPAREIGAWFVLWYLAVLGLTMVFIDADQAPDDRMLAPVFVALVVVVFDLIRRLEASPAAWGTVARRTTGAFCLALIASGAVAQMRSVLESTPVRRGYAHPAWRRSPSLARLAALPPAAPIYSNRPDAVRFLTGRPALGVPVKRDLHSRRPNAAYPAELAALRDRLHSGQATLVLFSTDPGAEAIHPSRREIENAPGPRDIHREADGVVYGRTGSGPTPGS